MSTATLLQFDPAAHRYTVNGRVWPSVTQVLDLLQDWSRVPLATMLAAQRFGDHVHLACHLWNAGRLDEDSLDAELVPYLNGWKRFIAETGAEVIESELRVHHPELRYAGTLDSIVRCRGEAWLVDIKSGQVPATVGAQTAAYERALHASTELRVKRRKCVQLMANDYRIHPLTDLSDWTTFVSALNCHRFMETHVWNSKI